MLNMNDLKTGTAFKYAGEPYQALKISHLNLGRGSAVIQAKIKNIRNGATLERNFKPADRFEELKIEKKKAAFLYAENDQCHFMDDDYEQFFLEKNLLKNELPFLKEGAKITILMIDNVPSGIELPPKVDLQVAEAPPAVRGDTAQGSVTKTVKLETGAEINTPIFIKEGDIIRVNTETGEYVERV